MGVVLYWGPTKGTLIQRTTRVGSGSLSGATIYLQDTRGLLYGGCFKKTFQGGFPDMPLYGDATQTVNLPWLLRGI